MAIGLGSDLVNFFTIPANSQQATVIKGFEQPRQD